MSHKYPLSFSLPQVFRSMPEYLKNFVQRSATMSSSLLSNPVFEDRFQLTISNSDKEKNPSLCLEPVSNAEKHLSIETWLSCFHIFVGVYTSRLPHEAPALMKHGEVVRDLAARGGNWKFYDENVRFLRQAQPASFPWGVIHWELWTLSLFLSEGTSNYNSIII